MKIVHVIDSSGVWGAEKMLFALVREQQRDAIPLVLSLGKPGEGKKQIEQAMDDLGIAYATVRMSALPRLSQLKEFARSIRELAPDVLHSHGYKGDILLALLKPLLRVPIVSTLHGWTTLPGSWTKLRLYELIHVKALLAIDAVVMVSPGIRNNPLFAKVPDSVRTRAATIENGISAVADPHVGQLPAGLSEFLADATVVGSIGRLSAEKGFSILVEAFAQRARQHKRLKLLLVGDGPERIRLENLARQVGLSDRVLVTGYVENASYLLEFFDVYVCSSLTEGLPITLLEAMRARVPIVSTAISNIPALLQCGSGGVLVEAGSAPAIAEALQRIFDDPDHAESLADRSYEHFAAHFSSGVMAERYAAVYSKLARG